MNNDAIEFLRIQTQMKHQWETLTTHLLMMWVMIVALLALTIWMAVRSDRLQSEIEMLKSRQTQRLTALAPATESRSAGDGRGATKPAGN